MRLASIIIVASLAACDMSAPPMQKCVPVRGAEQCDDIRERSLKRAAKREIKDHIERHRERRDDKCRGCGKRR